MGGKIRGEGGGTLQSEKIGRGPKGDKSSREATNIPGVARMEKEQGDGQKRSCAGGGTFVALAGDGPSDNGWKSCQLGPGCRPT